MPTTIIKVILKPKANSENMENGSYHQTQYSLNSNDSSSSSSSPTSSTSSLNSNITTTIMVTSVTSKNLNNLNHQLNNNRPNHVTYVNSEHLNDSFNLMIQMRDNGQLCDITLEVNDDHIKAHKIVLSATSAYFRAMFNSEMAERSKSVITLHDVDFNALCQLVDYSYTGKITITEENVQSLLPVASLLQISSVREACCQFLLGQLHPSNCLGINHFADAHSCEQLKQISQRYALENFTEVMQTEEFLLLQYNDIEKLISSNQLNVINEECVYNGVINWVKYDLKNREKWLGILMQHVRLPLMTRNFLLNKVSEEPLIQGNQDGKDLLIEAMKYHLSPERRKSMTSIRTQERKPDGLNTYLFAVGGGSLFAIHSECEFYNASLDQWCNFAATSQRRSRAGVIAMNRYLYVIGGYNGTKDLSSGEYYDSLVNMWSPITNMGIKRSCLGATTLNGLIYVGGGYDGASCLNSVERYDPLVATWSSMPAMEARRRYCKLAAVEGCLFAIGGHDGSNYQSSMERLDPREGKWYLMPSMTSRRSSCGVATLDNIIYVVGGNDGSLCMCTVERFNLTRNCWEQVPAMQSRRSTHEVVEAEGYLYAIGGNDGSSSLNTVERYEPQINKWTFINPMVLRRSSVGAAALQCPPLENLIKSKYDLTNTTSD